LNRLSSVSSSSTIRSPPIAIVASRWCPASVISFPHNKTANWLIWLILIGSIVLILVLFPGLKISFPSSSSVPAPVSVQCSVSTCSSSSLSGSGGCGCDGC
jgi:hypothetical protein